MFNEDVEFMASVAQKDCDNHRSFLAFHKSLEDRGVTWSVTRTRNLLEGIMKFDTANELCEIYGIVRGDNGRLKIK